MSSFLVKLQLNQEINWFIKIKRTNIFECIFYIASSGGYFRRNTMCKFCHIHKPFCKVLENIFDLISSKQNFSSTVKVWKLQCCGCRIAETSTADFQSFVTFIWTLDSGLYSFLVSEDIAVFLKFLLLLLSLCTLNSQNSQLSFGKNEFSLFIHHLRHALGDQKILCLA